MDTFNIERASTGLIGHDMVVIDDPEAPFTLEVSIDQPDGAARLAALTIVPRDGKVLRRNWLTSLPLREIFMAAAALTLGSESVNESYYRRLAAGGVAPLHDRVAAVANWAEQVKRPGAGSQAVADFWGVHPRTARRWLRHVRESSGASASPAPEDRSTRLDARVVRR
jgi:hypothetical protein